MDKKIQTLLDIAAEYVFSDQQETNPEEIIDVLVQDLSDAQDIVKNIMECLKDGDSKIELLNVVQLARFTMNFAYYIDTHENRIDENEHGFWTDVCERNILRGAIECCDMEEDFISLEGEDGRKTILHEFEIAYPTIEENMNALIEGNQLKIQGVYCLLIAVLEVFEHYTHNPENFNTELVFSQLVRR